MKAYRMCSVPIVVLCAMAVFAAQALAATALPTFQAARLFTLERGDADSQAKTIEGIAVGRDGRIYLSAEGHIKVFSPGGSLLFETQPKLDRAERFAVDGQGYIYVIHGASLALLSKFDPQGKLMSSDPSEASGLGGLGSERLVFDENGDLTQGEVMSFADSVAVAMAKYRISFRLLGISIDRKDRVHVLVDDRNPAGAGSISFNSDGSFAGIGPGKTEPIRFDGSGNRYVFCPTGNQSEAVALLMYSPQDVLEPVKPTLPASPLSVAGDTAVPLHGWTVDDAANIYCFAVGKRPITTDLGEGRSIAGVWVAHKLDRSGNVLAQSPGLSASPEPYGSQYLPVVDGRGRIYYLEFYIDHTDVMRGEFK